MQKLANKKTKILHETYWNMAEKNFFMKKVGWQVMCQEKKKT